MKIKEEAENKGLGRTVTVPVEFSHISHSVTGPGEREVVTLARSHGLEASRTWETAQHADPAVRCCDVLVAGRPCQVKRCAGGQESWRVWPQLSQQVR